MSTGLHCGSHHIAQTVPPSWDGAVYPALPVGTKHSLQQNLPLSSENAKESCSKCIYTLACDTGQNSQHLASYCYYYNTK